jgi:hypothetical protein
MVRMHARLGCGIHRLIHDTTAESDRCRWNREASGLASIGELIATDSVVAVFVDTLKSVEIFVKLPSDLLLSWTLVGMSAAGLLFRPDTLRTSVRSPAMNDLGCGSVGDVVDDASLGTASSGAAASAPAAASTTGCATRDIPAFAAYFIAWCEVGSYGHDCLNCCSRDVSSCSRPGLLSISSVIAELTLS